MGHIDTMVGARAGFVANNQTNAVEVTAWEMEVGVGRCEGSK